MFKKHQSKYDVQNPTYLTPNPDMSGSRHIPLHTPKTAQMEDCAQ